MMTYESVEPKVRITTVPPDEQDRHVKVHENTGEVLAVMYHHPCCGDPGTDPNGHGYVKHPIADHSW